ncbi:uncharacterized protein LOC132378075 isoform X2 [Hypanus sabinus]|uniref:uncharacterized protein LOC132378075 isoform X2 n=1 Tax=Hypanus sabinus TaxID=79690 RepID=UPI0028C3E6AF|nr:uncharacterized protein LOC132378075 isoform X2 [Hypanus sabinus]
MSYSKNMWSMDAQQSGRVDAEEEAITFSKEDEFLCHLSQEEKECLGFLIETIDALEVDLEEDDKEGATMGEGTIGDGFYEFLGMVCSTRPTDKAAGPDESGTCDYAIGKAGAVATSPATEKANIRSMAAVPGLDPTPNQKATAERDEKQKKLLKYQGSEATMGLESKSTKLSRIDEQCPSRSLTLLPAHARKFDTILRSGVSVQELRAQVLARLSGSAQQQPGSQTEGLATQSHSVRLLGVPEQRATRQLALQKPGSTDSTSARPQKSASPQSPMERDHEAALKKLGLLNL